MWSQFLLSHGPTASLRGSEIRIYSPNMCWNKTATVWWVSDYQITWLPGRESRRQITQMCESYCFLSCSQEEKQKRKHDGGRNTFSLETEHPLVSLFSSAHFDFLFTLFCFWFLCTFCLRKKKLYTALHLSKKQILSATLHYDEPVWLWCRLTHAHSGFMTRK